MFTRELAKERVGFWRWTAMFFALFGSYGRNDTVDVHYKIDGRDQVAAGLQIVPPEPSAASAVRAACPAPPGTGSSTRA